MKAVVGVTKTKTGPSPDTIIAELRAVHSTAAGSDEENCWPLFSTPSRLLVGRDEACDWSFNDDSLRRRHCLFTWDGKQLIAKSQISGYEWSFVVAPGTVLKLGSVRIVFAVLTVEPDEARTGLYHKVLPPAGAPAAAFGMEVTSPGIAAPKASTPDDTAPGVAAAKAFTAEVTTIGNVDPEVTAPGVAVAIPKAAPARPAAAAAPRPIAVEPPRPAAPRPIAVEPPRPAAPRPIAVEPPRPAAVEPPRAAAAPLPPMSVEGPTRVNIVAPPMAPRRSEAREARDAHEPLDAPEAPEVTVQVAPLIEARVVKPEEGWAGPDGVTKTFTMPTARPKKLRMPSPRVLLYAGAGVWLTGLMVWILWPVSAPPSRVTVEDVAHKPEPAAAARANPVAKKTAADPLAPKSMAVAPRPAVAGNPMAVSEKPLAQPKTIAGKTGHGEPMAAAALGAPAEIPAPSDEPAPRMFGPEEPRLLARAIDAYQRGQRSEARALFEKLTDRADVGPAAQFMVELLNAQLERPAAQEPSLSAPPSAPR
jgi:hypothetical protein